MRMLLDQPIVVGDGGVLVARLVVRPLDFVMSDPPAALAFEVLVDHADHGEVGQACAEAGPEGVPLTALGPPEAIPREGNHVKHRTRLLGATRVGTDP